MKKKSGEKKDRDSQVKKTHELKDQEERPKDIETKEKEEPRKDLKIEVLTEEKIKELFEKADERNSLLEELQRTKADYINYQKRIKKEKGLCYDFAVRDFAKKLLPVLDDFDRAIKAAVGTENLQITNKEGFKDFLEGIKIVLSQIYKVLEDEEITPIEAVGKKFDPSIHEAVFQVETDDAEEGIVLEELQKGYLFKGIVLRPSKVKVNKLPKKEPEEKPKEKQKEKSEVMPHQE